MSARSDLRRSRCRGRLRPFLTLLALLGSTPAWPQTPWPDLPDTETLGLSDAVERAVQWHPSIAEAVAGLAQQQQAIRAARAGYYPQIQGGLRTGFDSGYDERDLYPALVLSVSQMLYDFGKVSSAVRAAESARLAQEARALLAIDDVIFQTAQAGLEWQRYAGLSRIAAEQKQGLEDVTQLVHERHRQGATNRSEVIQSLSRVETAHAMELEYRAQEQRWQARLTTLLGSERLPRIAGHLPADLVASCSDQVLEQQAIPALLLAQAQLDQAQAQLDSARAQLRPTLSLEPSVTHYVNDLPTTNRMEEDRTSYGVYLSMNMALFQGGALRAQQQAAEHALASSAAARRNALLNARQTISEVDSQQAVLDRQLSVQDAREALSLQTRDLYRQQYLELGSRPLLDLLNAEQEIHQARLARHNLQMDRQLLALTCAQASGQLRDAFALAGRRIQGLEITP